MCGIFCSADSDDSTKSCQKCLLTPKVRRLLSNRGPTCAQEKKINADPWNLCFFASVLWLQGEEVTQQPACDSDGNILLWNGDVFEGILRQSGQSDTTALLLLLQEATKTSTEEICKVMGSIEGPWSFVYWAAEQRRLWFGRDSLGRHSLLWNVSPSSLVLSSCGERQLQLCEVPAAGIFSVQLDQINFSVRLFPWENVDTDVVLRIHQESAVDIVIEQKLQIRSALSQSCLLNPDTDDCFINLIRLASGGKSKLESSELFEFLLQDSEVLSRVEKLTQELQKAVDVRCKTLPKSCKQCMLMYSEEECNHSKVSVLFSGGLDSAIIAALAHHCVMEGDSIDLINVAFPCFQQVSSGAHAKQPTEPCFSTPDRVTGRDTLAELRVLYPDRSWNFVEVNVTKIELQSSRDESIADLIHPLRSILDDSLGCALWCASRGKGVILGESDLADYESPANVLLLGTGADELFGGYSKFKKCFGAEEDWFAVANQLAQDLANIPYRNLGRDDRVISDSGRQPRFPFLAENVVRYASSLPAHQRTAPLLPRGTGEKILLRLVAHHLGLHKAAGAPKRALQFGSKIAGLEGKKEQGHEVCDRLLIKL